MIKLNNKLPVYILIFCIFFISDDTVTFGTNNNQIFISGKYIIYLITSLLLFFNLNFSRSIIVFARKEVLYTLLLIISFFITIFLNFDFRNGYYLQLLTVSFAILIVKFLDFEVFLKYYDRLLFRLSIISIIVLIVVSFLPSVLSIFPTTVNFAGLEFKNLFVCTILPQTNLFRNTSIFREPGVFGIYLLFGITIQLFHNETVNKKHLIGFSIALITTFSTSAILILLLIIIGYMFKVNIFKVYITVFCVLVLSLMALVVLPELSNLLFSKLNSDSSSYVSTIARLSSFSVPFYIFLSAPAWGVGLTNFVELYKIYSIEIFGFAIPADSSSTNTIINTFAIFGFVYGTLLLYSLFKLSKRLGHTRLGFIIILLSILMMFSSQEMRYSLFFNVIVMYGLLLTNKRRLIL